MTVLITLTTGLADGFECTFVTLAGATLTVDVTGNTLYNNSGNVLTAYSKFILKRRIATNSFISMGDL